jgi:hypothetical protein
MDLGSKRQHGGGIGDGVGALARVGACCGWHASITTIVEDKAGGSMDECD